MTTSSNKIFGTFLGLEFREDSLVLTYVHNSFSGLTLLSSSTFTLRGSDDDVTGIREYMGQHGNDLQGIFVCIPDKWSITKFIKVPATKGKGKLDQLMSFEAERHIPFNLEDIVYDFQVTEEKDKIYTVVFTAVRKQKIDFIKEILDKLPLQPDLITTSSFAVLNAVELSGVSAGGWQHAIGFFRTSAVFGKKGETNILLHAEEDGVISAIVQNGIFCNIKLFLIEENDLDALGDEIIKHAESAKFSLGLEKYDTLIASGDTSVISQLPVAFSERLGTRTVTVDALSGIAKSPEGMETKSMVPSVGACFIGLGMGRFSINMLPHKREHNIRRTAPMVTQIALGVIVILILTIASVHYMKNRKFLMLIEEALKKNEPEIALIDKMTAQINLFEDKRDLLLSVRDNEVTLEVLAELTRILPQDAWITNLNYKGLQTVDKEQEGGELVISGFAASSSTLIPLLEDSPFFEKVEFVGPIKKTKDKEGFKLKAGIVVPLQEEASEKDIQPVKEAE